MLARPRLSSLIGLVLRHVGIEATVTASPARARLLLRQREPALLVANAGRRVARADIRDLSWGVEHAAPVEAVDAAVARLERTLGAVDVLRIERVDDAVVARLPALRMRSLHDARRRPAKN